MLNVWHLKARTEQDKLITMYLNYVAILLEDIDAEEMFGKLNPFYLALQEIKIPCEIIVFDENPITGLLDREIVFLGIDIINQYHESLLLDKLPLQSNANSNMLFQSIEDYHAHLDLLSEKALLEHEWRPCYVYNVIC